MIAVETPQILTKRRKITRFEAEQIAKLVSDSYLTEREACSILDIPSRIWEQWKNRNSRNKEQFEALFTRIRAKSIANSVKRISDCGDGIGLKQPDWRAKAHLLMLADRERFGSDKRDNGQAPPSTVNIAVMFNALDKILPAANQVKALSPSPEVSQA